MGRWAQARLRGSSPPGEPIEPAPSVPVVNVDFAFQEPGINSLFFQSLSLSRCLEWQYRGPDDEEWSAGTYLGTLASGSQEGLTASTTYRFQFRFVDCVDPLTGVSDWSDDVYWTTNDE